MICHIISTHQRGMIISQHHRTGKGWYQTKLVNWKIWPELYCANFKSTSHWVSCLLGKLEVYVNNVSCLHKHLLSVVGQTANRLYNNQKIQLELYCANFKSARHSVSCLLGKLEVYVNDVSCLHKHLLLVVGQTANRLYNNRWSGHRVTIITVNEQTARGLLFNPTVVLRYSQNDSYCVH